MEDIRKETRKELSPTHCDFCSCSWQTDEDPDLIEPTLSPASEGDSPQTNWIQADVTSLTNFSRLTHDQQSRFRGVAQMYKVLKSQSDLSVEVLQEASNELKQFYSMKDSMRIDKDDILEVRYAENGRDHWRFICPEGTRKTVIWQTL